MFREMVRLLFTFFVTFTPSATLAAPCESLLARAQLLKRLSHLGFAPDLATRIFETEDHLHPYFREAPQQLPPIRRKKVIDSARSWPRAFMPEQIRGFSGRAITVYRGLTTAYLPQDKISLNPKSYLSDRFLPVGNVIWVTRDFAEAVAYAARDFGRGGDYVDYVLEFQVPEFIYYQRNLNEGFLLPHQIRDLRSYLKGIHLINTKVEEVAWEAQSDSDYSQGVDLQVKPYQSKFIPFSQLPKKLLKN